MLDGARRVRDDQASPRGAPPGAPAAAVTGVRPGGPADREREPVQQAQRALVGAGDEEESVQVVSGPGV